MERTPPAVYLSMIFTFLMCLLPYTTNACDDDGADGKKGFVRRFCKPKFPSFGESMELTITGSDSDPKYKLSRKYCWFRNIFKHDAPCATSWGDIHSFEYGSTELESGQTFNLGSRKWCMIRYKKGDKLPSGETYSDNIPAVHAYTINVFTGSCRETGTHVTLYVNEPIPPGPNFSKVMPALVSVTVDDQIPPASSFEEPMITIKAGGGDSSKTFQNLTLKYSFDQTTPNESLCQSFQSIQSISDQIYCATIDDTRPWEVCACQASAATTSEPVMCVKKLGCVPRLVPESSRIKIIAENVENIINNPDGTQEPDDRPTMRVMFVRTNSDGLLRTISDGKEGVPIKIGDDGKRYRVHNGTQELVGEVEDVQYNTLPTSPTDSNTIKEYYKDTVYTDGQRLDGLAHDLKSFYKVPLMTFIPKYTENKIFERIWYYKVDYSESSDSISGAGKCVRFLEGSKNDSHNSRQGMVPQGPRDSTLCCPDFIQDKTQCAIPPDTSCPTYSTAPIPKQSDTKAVSAYCPGIYTGLNNLDMICLVSGASFPEDMDSNLSNQAKENIAKWKQIINEADPAVCDTLAIGLPKVTDSTTPSSRNGYALWGKGRTKATRCAMGFTQKVSVKAMLKNPSTPVSLGEQEALKEAEDMVNKLQNEADNANTNIDTSMLQDTNYITFYVKTLPLPERSARRDSTNHKVIRAIIGSPCVKAPNGS